MKDIDGIKLDGLWRERDGLGPESADDNKTTDEPIDANEARAENENSRVVSESPTKSAKRNEKPASAKRTVFTKKPSTARPRGKKSWHKPLLVILATLVIVGLATLVVLQYQENQRLRDPQYVAAEAEKANNDLLSRVSRLIQLPESTPIIYTVSNKDADDSKQMATSLGVTFENDDRILIYSEDKLFVVYRPTGDQIIKSGPIAITAAEDSGEQQQQ